jgi:hypothetical protein|tara:strand:+ start:18127 stop:18408 length:282 start_codon:yes stop_codon:yes gene_type:complete
MANPYIGNAPTARPLTSADIEDGSITTPKLATDAVTTVKINNGAVTTAKLDSTIAPAIVGGTVDNAPIGATTANTGTFTTVTATTGISGGTFS